jgi:hypothetical protein
MGARHASLSPHINFVPLCRIRQKWSTRTQTHETASRITGKLYVVMVEGTYWPLCTTGSQSGNNPVKIGQEEPHHTRDLQTLKSSSQPTIMARASEARLAALHL